MSVIDGGNGIAETCIDSDKVMDKPLSGWLAGLLQIRKERNFTCWISLSMPMRDRWSRRYAASPIAMAWRSSWWPMPGCRFRGAVDSTQSPSA